MDYKMLWLVPSRVVDIVIPTDCDDEFVRAFDKDLSTMLEGAPQRIHMLVDVREVKTYPSTQSVFQFKSLRHPHMGRVITIGGMNNPITRFLASMLARAAGVQMKDFYTREEARAYLSSIENIVIDS